MATYKTLAQDGFDWWCEEFSAIWANFVREAKQPKSSDWTIGIADDGIRVHAAGGPEFQSPPLPLEVASDEIAALLRSGRRHPSVAIRIDSALVLKRQLGARRLPVRQARDMAELDLLASTPIDPTQVHIVFPEPAEQDCFFHVVKTKTLAAIVDAVRQTGGSVRSLSLSQTGSTLRADPLSLAAIWPPTAHDRRVKAAWMVGCSMLIGTALVTFGHAQWRTWHAASELDAQIADAQIQAKAARLSLQKRQTGIEQVERIRQEKKTSASVVRVWAELTRLLPDTTWLTDLSSKGGELTITGFSTSAAELIKPLDASSLFSAPEFAAPVVKVPGQDGERFTITAKIRSL